MTSNLPRWSLFSSSRKWEWVDVEGATKLPLYILAKHLISFPQNALDTSWSKTKFAHPAHDVVFLHFSRILPHSGVTVYFGPLKHDLLGKYSTCELHRAFFNWTHQQWDVNYQHKAKFNARRGGLTLLWLPELKTGSSSNVRVASWGRNADLWELLHEPRKLSLAPPGKGNFASLSTTYMWKMTCLCQGLRANHSSRLSNNWNWSHYGCWRSH